MNKILFLTILIFCYSCSSYKDAKSPSDILNIYNEAALNYDFASIDKITLKSDLKAQLQDALAFMKENELFFSSLKNKFPTVSDTQIQQQFPVLFEIYSQMSSKKAKGFKPLKYKTEFKGDEAVIFEVATKRVHTFKKVNDEWKKEFSEGEINFERAFYIPDSKTYQMYMKFISTSTSYEDFKANWKKVPVDTEKL